VTLFIITRLNDKMLKARLVILIIAVAFVVPMGSRSVQLSMIFPTILMIPIISVLLLSSGKHRILYLAIVPFLVLLFGLEVKGRIADYLIRNEAYSAYSDNKLKGIHDLTPKVDELEEIAESIRNYLPHKDYFLVYQRFPIFYWLVENAVPAVPKIDLETSYSYEWIEYNLIHMVEHGHIPEYVFIEDLVDKPKDDDEDAILQFVREHYTMVDRVCRFNIYRLADNVISK